MPRRFVFMVVAWMAAVASTTLALASDPFLQADAVSELGIARAADEAGDELLLAHVAAPKQRQLALIAARASPYARAPEALIPALAALACGRDPDLSAQAAHALRAIAGRLQPSVLAAREVLKSDLSRAREALSCGAAEVRPRADIAAELEQLGAALDGLL